MKTASKNPVALSPLMRQGRAQKNTVARLAGTLSKARARDWMRHIKKARAEWR